MGVVNQAVGTTVSTAGKITPIISMAYAGYQVYTVVQPILHSYFNRNQANVVNFDGSGSDDEDEVLELVVSPRRRPRNVASSRQNANDQQVLPENGEPSTSSQNQRPTTATQGRGTNDDNVELINELGVSEIYNVSNTSGDNEVEIIDEIPGTREIEARFQERLREDSEEQAGPSSHSVYLTPSRRIVFVDDQDDSDDLDNLDHDQRNNRTYPDLPPYDPTNPDIGEAGLDLNSDLLCQICGRFLHHADKEIAALPFCDHLFHEKCIQGVMTFSQRCPKCDSSIFSPI